MFVWFRIPVWYAEDQFRPFLSRLNPNTDKFWMCHLYSNRRFTGPRPEGGFDNKFGEKKETSAADEDDDFWGYAEEGADANL